MNIRNDSNTAALAAGDASTRLNAALAIGSNPGPELVEVLVARCAMDFAHDVAYFATAGTSPTTGYGIAVEGLRRSGSAGTTEDALEVDVKVFKPGQGCVNATLITVPYVIITFPREALNRGVINLNLNEKITNCSG